MRDSLRNWIADADTRHSVATFALPETLPVLAYQEGRLLDLYTSLVGDLFALLRAENLSDPRDLPTLGNGLSLVGSGLRGRTQSDAFFFAAAAYYIGGLSASAYLTMRRADPRDWDLEEFRACYDLLARPAQVASAKVGVALAALAEGNSGRINALRGEAGSDAATALHVGPDEWVSSRVLLSLLERFATSNVRAVLPNGDTQRWTPLVTSFLERRPPVWDFFPSQVEAIEAGLLGTDRTFSLQMPTGSGKTALTETLIYDHLTGHPDDVAVLLVPFRSLARELRGTMGKRLTDMGFPTRTVYGGTVPTPEETQEFESVRTVIATPEAMMGLLGSLPELAGRISLLVCDEGHLLDSASRGVGLELLLARFMARPANSPRMVFVSAVVPNIEEINAWLGGSPETVVRSEFRPADAEYAVLRASGRAGRQLKLDLELRAQTGTSLPNHTIPAFLAARDFEYLNEATNRTRTYSFDAFKTQAIAAARKALPLGTVAVFTRTKGGNQGVLALAQELSTQLKSPLPLPRPSDYVGDADRLAEMCAYLTAEYGGEWVGTTALEAGAVVHHGDIPQETREALEEILVAGTARLVLCTSTLAEGVNLPIRTLVVYTTHIRTADGNAIPMLAREIRNLVGRAGRAGSATKGLVICANPNQWDVMTRIANGAPGEPVQGALRELIEWLVEVLSTNNRTLTNAILEGTSRLFSLVDGIDATLIELLRDDVGDEEFHRVAATLASSTYAYQQTEARPQSVLEEVFSLRADRLTGLRVNGRLNWALGTGVRARLLDSVADSLAPSFDRWQTVESVLDEQLLDVFLTWARRQPDFRIALREAYPERELIPTDGLPPQADLRDQLRLWLSGNTFAEIASTTARDVDRLLRIHTGVISYSLTTMVEQAVAVLGQLFNDTEPGLSPAVAMLPDFIRYGVSTPAARNLMADGVRHRRAANLLGSDPNMIAPENALLPARDVARSLLETEPTRWAADLGSFVFVRTARDVGVVNLSTS